MWAYSQVVSKADLWAVEWAVHLETPTAGSSVEKSAAPRDASMGAHSAESKVGCWVVKMVLALADRRDNWKNYPLETHLVLLKLRQYLASQTKGEHLVRAGTDVRKEFGWQGKQLA
jgi:hypothetical protein